MYIKYIILLLVILIYFYKRKVFIENFNTGEHRQSFPILTPSLTGTPEMPLPFPENNPQFNTLVEKDRWKHLSIWNKRPLRFNQNWNKVWKVPAKSDQSTTVQDLPNSDPHAEPATTSLINMFTGDQIKLVLENLVDPTGLQNPEYTNEKFKSIIANPQVYFEKQNQKTWIDRKNRNHDYPIIPYDYPVINRIINNFMIQFNNQIREQYPNYIEKFRFIPFQLYKYKVVGIEENPQKYRRYSLILVILRNVPVSRGFTIFTQYIVTNSGDLIFQNFDLIGIYTTDKLWMTPGYEKSPEQKDLLKDPEEDGIHYYNVKKFLDNRIKEEEERRVEHQPACFNNNNADPRNVFIFATGKNMCESKYDFYGRAKPTGVWDRPCKSDSECPFNGANKNYKNEFGKCVNGYCQLPVGLKPQGYHHYFSDGKPLCYNCNSKEWKSTTTLGKCCEDQKDKDKYPFLDGPDYAFRGDIFQRMNQEYVKRGCYSRPLYKTIFSKEPENEEVICP